MKKLLLMTSLILLSSQSAKAQIVYVDTNPVPVIARTTVYSTSHPYYYSGRPYSYYQPSIIVGDHHHKHGKKRHCPPGHVKKGWC